MDGIFTLKAPKNATMVISYVGMETQEITIDDRTFYRVILLEDVELLQEVVVTGYQTIPRERATGAYAILGEEELTSKINANLLDQIEGMVPGLLLNGDNFLIRGVTTINGVSEPLIIVDGMPYEGDISLLSPSNITNVTVLKDAAASSIYGARAANGCLLYTSPQGGVLHLFRDILRVDRLRAAHVQDGLLIFRLLGERAALLNHEEVRHQQVYSVGIAVAVRQLLPPFLQQGTHLPLACLLYTSRCV